MILVFFIQNNNITIKYKVRKIYIQCCTGYDSIALFFLDTAACRFDRRLVFQIRYNDIKNFTLFCMFVSVVDMNTN